MRVQLLTIEQIASFVGDEEENIIEFIREDRIPYVYHPDGILIPLGGFQMCMNDLYPLEEYLEEIRRAVKAADDDALASEE